MNIIYSKFKNLFSYNEGIVQLHSLTLALFKGKNGTGKSSFFDILCWTLYGQTARKKYKNILRNTPDKPKKGYGEIVWHDKEVNKYKVIRNIGSNKSLKLEINDVDCGLRTPTLIQEEINKIIGVDFRTFLNIAYFSQGDIGKFLTSESGERIKVVTEMVDELSVIDKIKILVDGDGKKISYESENLKGQLMVHKEIISGVEIQPLRKEYKMTQSAISHNTDMLVKSSTILSSLREKKEFTDELESQKENYASLLENSKDALSSIKNSIHMIKKKVENHDEVLLEYNDVVKNLKDYGNVADEKIKIQEKISALEKKNSVLKAKIDLNNNEVAELEEIMKLKDSTCPTCKADITEKNIQNLANICTHRNKESSEYNISIGKNLKVLKKHYSDKIKIDNSMIEMNKLVVYKNDLKGKLKAIGESKSTIAELVKEYDEKKEKFQASLTSKKNKIKNIKDDLKHLVKYDLKDLEKEQDEFNRLDGLVDQLSNKEKDIKNKMDNYYSSVKKITEAEKGLSDLADDDKVISFWKNALPKIKVDMISGIIPFLESETNKYLSQILPGKMIKFIADSSKSNNKLDVVIYDYENDVERIYEGWSGGEKAKMSISVYLALNKLASVRSGKSIDFIILDEKFSAIDYESRMVLMEMLKSEYKGRKIWAISHVENLDSEFDQVITAELVDGISKLRIDA